MNRRLLFSGLVLTALFGATFVDAQVLITKTKARVNLADVEVRGDTVFQKKKLADGGSAEIGIPIASIVGVEWPLPPALEAAEAEIEQGSPLAAIPAIKRELAVHLPYRKIPGSHWVRAQTAYVRALACAGLPDPAERELAVLKADKPPAETLTSLEFDIVLARSKDDWTTYAPKLTALREAGLAERDSARLWLAQGEYDRRRGQPEKALFAFLQVTVFHPKADHEQPAALLGTVRCYRALGETEQAGLAVDALTARFADSPETAAAIKETPAG